MEQSTTDITACANLMFQWSGVYECDKKEENLDIALVVNDNQIYRGPYKEAFAFDIPITGEKLKLEILTGKNSKTVLSSSSLSHTFKIKADTNYSCYLEGELKDSNGLKFSMYESDNPDVELKYSSPVPIFMRSFLFPIYGLYKLTGKENRIAALVGALLGFGLAVLLSAQMESYETITLGFKSFTLLEYSPFSFLDFLVNILAGGLLSITMGLSLLMR